MTASTKSLESLEHRRLALLDQISALGDFRPGSITATTGRCGNTRCHCHQPGDPGHGPNSRLTFKNHGKTVTESFPTETAKRKAEREIAAFRQWQQLSRELVEVNTKICQRRPVEETLSPQGKNGRGDPGGSPPRSEPLAGSGLPRQAPDDGTGGQRNSLCAGKPGKTRDGGTFSNPG